MWWGENAANRWRRRRRLMYDVRWSEIWRGERSAAREPRPASSSLTSPTHNDIPAPLCYTYNTREMRKSGVTRDTARRYLNTVNMTMAHRQHISEQLSKSLSRLWGFWPKTSAYVSLETTILHFKGINICSIISLLFGWSICSQQYQWIYRY